MPLSISHRIRQWLVNNPGRHFPCDVQQGLGATSPKARASISALLSNMAQAGLLGRAGKPGSYRYWANALTARAVGYRRGADELTPLEQAFEAFAVEFPGAFWAVEWIRERAARIANEAAP